MVGEETLLIHIIRRRATENEMSDMLQTLDSYIKLAVDVGRGVLAGGGEMHADCEHALLADGGAQEDIWGADWSPDSQVIEYASLINIRPAQGNRSLEVSDPDLRGRIARIVMDLLGGDPHA